MKLSYLSSALIFACVAGSASAELYALSSDSPGTVYTVDGSTAAASSVVTLSAGLTSITDIEFLNGVAYVCDYIDNSGWEFGTVDLSTGVFTGLNNQDGSANWWGLAANQSLGLLYTIDANDNGNLKSITAAGAITTIGVTGFDGGGMTYDNNNGVLYASDGSSLFTINESTGASTLIGALGAGLNNSMDLAYDEDLNVLYAVGDGNLFTVNTFTGSASLVGSLGQNEIIDGLGWRSAPVPEPATMAVLGMGALALLRRRKK